MSFGGLQAPPTQFTSAFRYRNVNVKFHSEGLHFFLGSASLQNVQKGVDCVPFGAPNIDALFSKRKGVKLAQCFKHMVKLIQGKLASLDGLPTVYFIYNISSHIHMGL